MKKTICTMIAAVLLAGAMAFSFAGCGNPPEGNLRIAIYNGGYGVEWAYALADKFSKENNGVIVDIKPDNGLLTTLTADLRDKKNTKNVDLYFSHKITWEIYAAQKLIEPLDDLYEMTVDGEKFEQRVIPEARETSKYLGNYYKVPWVKGAGGIVYNVGMFRENNWTPPETYEDLTALCDTIVAANITNPVSGKKVAPFIWSGEDSWLLDYIVFPWWAQLAGFEKIERFVGFESADVYNPADGFKELKEAFTFWYDLFAPGGKHANSVEGSDGTNKFTAQAEFVTGGAAMMANAHWLFNETKASIRPDSNFEMAMIPAPTVPGAREGYEKVNFSVGFGDSMILASNSRNKALAKEFLRFMASEENCLLFSSYVPGTSLAFDYDMKDADVTSVHGANANVFAQSVAKMHSDYKSFNIYSTSPLSVTLGGEMIAPWLENTYFYRDAYQNAGKYTPAFVFDDIYSRAVSNWDNWKAGAGL
ncbi:MAG: ABC transporter substrate-binding protein [Clostridiales bacterium]|jgi:ABC-type glycerol-3-phosphate transport system substrate-binding protein|nr:ABC transporter substrate-binding protein [Clostridiales bacterium]